MTTPAETREESSELMWLALAYLDAGSHLARAIVEGGFENSVHRQRVPLFLVHQALELLFKSALAAKLGVYPKGHDLSELSKTFQREFPTLAVDVPQGVLASMGPTLELFPDDPPKHKLQHERFRYPSDRGGRPWHFPEDLDMSESLNEFEALSSQILKVRQEVLKLAESQ